MTAQPASPFRRPSCSVQGWPNLGTVMGHLRVLLISLIAALSLPDLAATPAEPAGRSAVSVVAPQLPPGFRDTVVTKVAAPTALTWTPDGRMVITSKPGRVIVRHEDGTRTIALDISARVCAQIERGLVGVAVDPNFDTNRFLYLYYTHKVRGSCGGAGPDPANRVSRFVLGADDTIARSSERVLVDHIVSPEGASHRRGPGVRHGRVSVHLRRGRGRVRWSTRRAAGRRTTTRYGFACPTARSSGSHGPADRRRRIRTPTRAGRADALDPPAYRQGPDRARRSSPPGSATRSGSPGSREPTCSTSTTSASTRGKRWTGSARAATTGGTSGKGTAAATPPPTADASVASPTPSTTTATATAAPSPEARSSLQGCGRGGEAPTSTPTSPAERSSDCGGRPTAASAGAPSCPEPEAPSTCGSARTATRPRSTT